MVNVMLEILDVFFSKKFRKIGKTLEVKRVSKIWVRMTTTNIHLIQFNI